MSGKAKAERKSGAHSRWRLDKFIAFALIFLILPLGALTGFFLTQPISGLGVQDTPMITNLIYPTLGNPVIVQAGTTFTAEFDPRDRQFDNPVLLMHQFQASATMSHGPYPVTRTLPVVSATLGYSKQWPEYAKSEQQDRRLYLVTIQAPRDMPRDLYNLTVQARRAGATDWITSTQPHALDTVDAFNDDFSFVQLTDIHVWGQEVDYPSCTYHERSRRPRPIGLNVDRKGALYYQTAIDQINLLHPDFCVFSGDYMFGQDYFAQNNGPPWGVTTEYEYEMLWFYQETLKLDVPVFMTIGNHDGDNEGSNGAHEDWFVNWRDFFGPIYHSYDYGGYHFLSLNTMDWSAADRQLNNMFDVMLSPTKYKGQLLGGGDRLSPGVSDARLQAIDESKFTGQLAWIRDDLRATQGAKMRVCVMHHDPWKTDGSGEMWGVPSKKAGLFQKIKQAATEVMRMGDGQGRLSVIELMKRYKVTMELSGHDHSDYVGSTQWYDGSGTLHFINTTSTQFDTTYPAEKYPGYRRVVIAGGQLQSFNYQEPKWSYPIWADTPVGGVTDPNKLTQPALRSAVSPGGGNAPVVSWTASSVLNTLMPGVEAEIAMPMLKGGNYYQAVGAAIVAARDEPGASPEHRVYTLRTDIAPEETAEAKLLFSETPDTAAPGGNITVSDGSGATSSLQVALHLDVSDSGGAGMGWMLLSNNRDFSGAEWQPFMHDVPWTLASGGAGRRTVYLKLRDLAMPANESPVISAGVTYAP